MTRAFIAEVLQEEAGLGRLASLKAAGAVVDAIVKSLKTNRKFTLPSVGTLRVHQTKARSGVNPRTGERIKIAKGQTVRFKVSRTLRQNVAPTLRKKRA